MVIIIFNMFKTWFNEQTFFIYIYYILIICVEKKIIAKSEEKESDFEYIGEKKK